MHLDIHRFDQTANYTVSRIRLRSEPGAAAEATYYGMERPWQDNQPRVSCVPPGIYVLLPFSSPRFGRTWCLVGGTVFAYPLGGAQRSACLLHAGNFATDVEGCIAVGLGEGRAEDGRRMVTTSRQALTALLEALRAQPHHTVLIHGGASA